MNIEQIHAAAESECSCLADESCCRIYVASSANDSRADRIRLLFEESIEKTGFRAETIRAGSFGYYALEPIVVIHGPKLPAALYPNVDPDKASDLIQNSLLTGAPGTAALCRFGEAENSSIPHFSNIPLFNLQRRVALRNCGWIDPGNIHHYMVRAGGYRGLARALSTDPQKPMGPLLDKLLKSRRRVGDSSAAGWRRCAESKEQEKCLICSAMDADPASISSRLLLESDPHSVLEGMLIGAHAIGASRCILYLKEDASAAAKLRTALGQMHKYNLLGSHILDSDFSLEIEIQEVPESCAIGYWVETFRCLEENQPPPRMIPEFPGADRLREGAVAVTSPEILADLAAVLIEGEDNEEIAESKIVTLSGGAINKFTVEVALGAAIRDLADGIGAGCSGERPIKTALLGGPSGLFFASNSFSARLSAAGEEESRSGIGFDTIEILDAGASVLDAVKVIFEHIQAHSCGKCVFCREGSLQILTVLEDILGNRGKPQDLDLLAELGERMKTGCLCEFGRLAASPLLSSMEIFRREYEERIPAPHL